MKAEKSLSSRLSRRNISVAGSADHSVMAFILMVSACSSLSLSPSKPSHGMSRLQAPAHALEGFEDLGIEHGYSMARSAGGFLRSLRQRSEQNFTPCQVSANFLRQVIGRPQTMHTLRGRWTCRAFSDDCSSPGDASADRTAASTPYGSRATRASLSRDRSAPSSAPIRSTPATGLRMRSMQAPPAQIEMAGSSARSSVSPAPLPSRRTPR